MRLLTVLVAGCTLVCGAAGPVRGQAVTLETLRERVARNEALIDPIKLDYTVKITQTGERPQLTGGARASGRSFSHYDVTWARRGPMQYTRLQTYYGPNEPARSELRVFDDRRGTLVYRPDHVSVGPTTNADWYHVLTAKLRLRPFEDQEWLSELLVPSFATLQRDMATVDGRSAPVVDIVRPDRAPSVERLWIDRETAMPLRACLYDAHPAAPGARLILEVNDVTPYRLPNGGWIPVSGVRVVHFRTRSGYEHVSVDVNSITTEVPDSLFRVDLPEGGTTYDIVTRLTTVQGRTAKTYEQVVETAEKFIAGVVVDVNGGAISGAVLEPIGVTTRRADGRTSSRTIRTDERACAVTDARGRFALPLEDEGSYHLDCCAVGFVDRRLRGISLGQHDVKVVLDKGGTVAGRVFFLADGRREPLAGADIYARATDRLVDAATRSFRKQTRTDEQGRFELACLPTQMRDRTAASSEPARYIPMPWEIRSGMASADVTFERDGDRKEIELLLKPNARAAAPLVSKPLPDLAGLGLDVSAEDIEGRRVLVCFFDMEQRPARRCLVELAQRATSLADRGVVVLAVHEKGIDPAQLGDWTREAGVPFPVGIIAGDPDEVKFAWVVRSLPWLILTDRAHTICAEGFGLDELDTKMATLDTSRPSAGFP